MEDADPLIYILTYVIINLTYTCKLGCQISSTIVQSVENHHLGFIEVHCKISIKLVRQSLGLGSLDFKMHIIIYALQLF